MISILWTDTVLGSDGVEYTAEIEPDWMAGHGVFTDDNGEPNRFRWTIYRNSDHRPRVAYHYGIRSKGLAIQQATDKLRSYR